MAEQPALTGERPQIVEGLQIWTPELSFNRDYNIKAFRRTLSGLSTVDVKFTTESENLYCTGPDRIAYEVVGSEQIQKQIKGLNFDKTPRTCLGEGLVFEERGGVVEEAQVRALHFGLGRTCLRVAILADKKAEFNAATQDFISVFNMLTIPTHNIYEIMAAGSSQSLTYLFKKAAQRHCSLSLKQAERFVQAIAAGVLTGREWLEKSAPALESAIGYDQAKLKHVRKVKPTGPRPKPRTDVLRKDDPTQAVIFKEKTSPPARSNLSVFVGGLDVDTKVSKIQDRLRRMNSYYVKDQAKDLPPMTEQTKKQIACAGILAYIDAHEKEGSILATRILRFLGPIRGYKKDPLPFLTTANYFVGKINQAGGFKPNGNKRSFPGLQPEAIPQAFDIIRYALTHIPEEDYALGRPKTRETRQQKMIGDLAQAYLDLAYK